MDLLRLVLAKQPLDRLLNLPVLADSKTFVRAFQQPFDREGWTNDFIGHATTRGELCRESMCLVSCGNLRNRAVFLRDAKWYKFFRNGGEEDLDFWYAIESGIPEIQSQAIAGLMLKPRKVSSVLLQASMNWNQFRGHHS